MPAQFDGDGNFELRIPVFRSVNLLRDIQRIGDDECEMARNIFPVRPGKMGVRPGSQILDLNYGNATSGGNRTPQSGVVSQFLPSVSAVVAIFEDGTNGSTRGTKLIRVPQDSTNGQLLLDLKATCKRPLFSQYNGNVLVFPGYPYVHAYVQLVDTGGAVIATPMDFAGSTGTARVPQGGAPYRSRFVHWNFGKGFESHLLFSDNYNPNVVQSGSGDPLAANGRALIVGGSRDGDRIVACVELMLTAVGSPTQSALLVLKEKSVYLITGEPNQTTDNPAVVPFLNTLNVARVAYNCGCSAPETVSVTPYGTFWAGPDDVWMFQLGQGTPVRVGTKIRPALQRTPPSMRYKWTGVYFNGLYRLTLAGDGQSPGDLDLLTDEWWLDLRDGPPSGDPAGAEAQESASWWGPMQYSCYAPADVTHFDDPPVAGTYFLMLDDRVGFDPILYACNVGWVTSTGGSPGIILLQRDAPDTRDITFDAFGGGANSEPSIDHVSGSEITFDLRTKQFDLDWPKLRKIFLALDLGVWISETFGLQLEVILDGGNATDAQTRVVDSSGFALGQGQVDIGPAMAKVPQAVSIKASTSRDAGFTVQLHLSDAGGIWIDATNDHFAYVASQVASGTVNIADGFYTDIDAVGTAIVAAMNVRAGSAFAFAWLYGDKQNPAIQASLALGIIWAPTITDGPTSKLLAMMGFDLSDPTLVMDLRTHTGGPTYRKNAPVLELSEFTMTGILIPRPPI